MPGNGSDAGYTPTIAQTLRWCCFCDRRFASPTQLSAHLDRYNVNWKLFWQMCHESNVSADNVLVYSRRLCKPCNVLHSDSKSLECHIKMVHCISGQPCALRSNSADTEDTQSGHSRPTDKKAMDNCSRRHHPSSRVRKGAKDRHGHPQGKPGSVARKPPSMDAKAGFNSGNPPGDKGAVKASPVISQTKKDAGENIDIDNVDIVFEIPGPNISCPEASSEESPRPQPSTSIPLAREAVLKQSEQRSDSDDEVEVIGEITLKSNVCNPTNTVEQRNQFSQFEKKITEPASSISSNMISVLYSDDEIEELDTTDVVLASVEHERKATHVLQDAPEVSAKAPSPSTIFEEDEPAEPPTVTAQIHLPGEGSLERPTAVVNPFGLNEEPKTTRPNQDHSSTASNTGYRLEEADEIAPNTGSEAIKYASDLPEIYLESSDDEIPESAFASSQGTPSCWPNSTRPDIDPDSADLGRLTPSKIAALMNRSLLPESRQMDVLRMVDSITANDGIESRVGQSGAAARGREGTSSFVRTSDDVSNERSPGERMPWSEYGDEAAEWEEQFPNKSDNDGDHEAEPPACSLNIVSVETLTNKRQGKAMEGPVDPFDSEGTGVFDRACSKAGRKNSPRGKPHPTARKGMGKHNNTRQCVVANEAASKAPEEELHVFKQPLWECVGTIMPGSLVEVLIRDDPALAGGSESLDAMVMKVEETRKDVWCYIKFPNMDPCHNRWVTMRDIIQVYRTQNPDKPRSFAPLAEWSEPGLPPPCKKSPPKRRLAFNPSPEVFKRQRTASAEGQHVPARSASSTAKKGAKNRSLSCGSSRKTSAKSSSVQTQKTTAPAPTKAKIPTAKPKNITSKQKKQKFTPRVRYSGRHLGKDSPFGAGSIMDGTADSASLTNLLEEAASGKSEASSLNSLAKRVRSLRDILSPRVVLVRSKILDASVRDKADKPEADETPKKSGCGAEAISSASSTQAPDMTSELVCREPSGQDTERSRNISDEQSSAGQGHLERVKHTVTRPGEVPMTKKAIVSDQDPLTLSRQCSDDEDDGAMNLNGMAVADSNVPSTEYFGVSVGSEEGEPTGWNNHSQEKWMTISNLHHQTEEKWHSTAHSRENETGTRSNSSFPCVHPEKKGGPKGRKGNELKRIPTSEKEAVATSNGSFASDLPNKKRGRPEGAKGGTLSGSPAALSSETATENFGPVLKGTVPVEGRDQTPSAPCEALTSIAPPSPSTADHLESAVNETPLAGRWSKRLRPVPDPAPSLGVLVTAEDGATLSPKDGWASVASGANGSDPASVLNTTNSVESELVSLHSKKSDHALLSTSDAVLPVVGSLVSGSSPNPDSSGCALSNVGSAESPQQSGRLKRRTFPCQRSAHSLDETEDVLSSKTSETFGSGVSALQDTDAAESAPAPSVSYYHVHITRCILPCDMSSPGVNMPSSQNLEKTSGHVNKKVGRPRKRLPPRRKSSLNLDELACETTSKILDPVARDTACALKPFNSEEPGAPAAAPSSVPSLSPCVDLVPVAKNTRSGTGSVPSAQEGLPKRPVRLPHRRSSRNPDTPKNPTTLQVAGALRKKTASAEEMSWCQTADEKSHLVPSASCAAVLPISPGPIVSPSPLADGTSSARDVSRGGSAVHSTPSPRAETHAAERRRSKSMNWPPDELQCVDADLDVLEEVEPRDLLAVVTRTDDDGQRWLQTAEVVRVGKKEHEGSFFVQKLTSRKWSPEWVEGDLVQSKILVESGGSWKENPDLLDMLRRTWRAAPEEDQCEDEALHVFSEGQGQAQSYPAPSSPAESIEQTNKLSLSSSRRMQGTTDRIHPPIRDPPDAQNAPAASPPQPFDSKDAFQQLFSIPDRKAARSPSPESKDKLKELLKDSDVKTTLPTPSDRKPVFTQLLSGEDMKTTRIQRSDCKGMFTRLLSGSDIKTEKLEPEPDQTESAAAAQTKKPQPRRPRLVISEPVADPQPFTSAESDGFPPAHQYWSKAYNPKGCQMGSSRFLGMTLSIPRLNLVEYERGTASVSSETAESAAATRRCGSGRRGIRKQSFSSSGASDSSEGSFPLPRSSLLFSARLLASEKQDEATPNSATPAFPVPGKTLPAVPDEEPISRRRDRASRAHYSAPALETELRGPKTKAKGQVSRPSHKSSGQRVKSKYLKQSRTVAAAACRRSLRTIKASESAEPSESEAALNATAGQEAAAESVTTDTPSSELETAGPACGTNTERGDSASTAGSERDATIPTIEMNVRSLNRLKPGDVIYVSYETMEDDTQFVYPAKVLLVNREMYYPRFRIHYLGWGKRYDEWIAREVIHSIVDRSLLPPNFRLKQRVVRPSRAGSSVLYRTLRPCSVNLSLNNICYFSALRKEQFTVDDRRIMAMRAAVRYRGQAQPPAD